MPVPQPISEPQRQLIRDVAYSRIRDEILNGQLEPGEKLNDADLTAWLGVSRTPIREAIAMLAADGLIEMEPNRYTRIPDRSPDAYQRAAEYMHMIRGFVLDHLDRIPPKDLAEARKEMNELLPRLREHDRDAQILFKDEFGELAAMIDNPPHHRRGTTRPIPSPVPPPTPRRHHRLAPHHHPRRSPHPHALTPQARARSDSDAVAIPAPAT